MIQQLVMYEEELAQINHICEVLHRDANARAVLVIDKNGKRSHKRVKSNQSTSRRYRR